MQELLTHCFKKCRTCGRWCRTVLTTSREAFSHRYCRTAEFFAFSLWKFHKNCKILDPPPEMTKLLLLHCAEPTSTCCFKICRICKDWVVCFWQQVMKHSADIFAAMHNIFHVLFARIFGKLIKTLHCRKIQGLKQSQCCS